MTDCEHDAIIRGGDQEGDPVACANCPELGYITIVWNDHEQEAAE